MLAANGANGAVANQRLSFASGRSYPIGVSLAAQFSVRTQLYGSCHVYAAVAATQAACFRRTSKVLELSEGYLFGLHLRAAAENPASYPFLTINFASLFSENNAGAYSATFERIQRGQLRLDSEYSMNDLTSDLAASENIRDEYWKLAALRPGTDRHSYESQMRSQIIRDVGRGLESKVGKRNLHPDVAACDSQRLRIRHIQPTPERIVRLINAGFPVICQFRVAPPSSSSHVYVLAGYRANSSLKDGIELLARDSLSVRLLEPGLGLNCYAASVIYGQHETRAFEAALNF